MPTSSATWSSTISRVVQTYHVPCSLRPETRRSVFLTYGHGYPRCLDFNVEIGSAPRVLLAIRYLYQIDTLPDIRCLLNVLSPALSTAEGICQRPSWA